MKKVLFCLLCAVFILCSCSVPDNNAASDESGVATKKIEEPIENKEDIEKENEAVQASSEIDYNVAGKVIVIDAGHCIFSKSRQEQIAPDSEQTKPAFVSGTVGANQTEEELNLAVALKLQKQLTDMGAEVHMTRTTHESDMSNIDRAVFGNELNADISVKIHADGSADSTVHGVSVLVPGDAYIKDEEMIKKSRVAAEFILDEFAKETGAVNRGISVRNDMTGFNWSTIPVVLVEMGFMTNPEEDRLMETDEYQNKIVQGIVNGLELYFRE